jgi:hypothetical protein
VDSAELVAVQAQESLAVARIDFQLARWERYRSLDARGFPAALLSAVAGDRSN